MTEEPALLICVAVADLAVPAHRSVRVTADCGHEVWMSPASIGMISSGSVTATACVACGTPKVGDAKVMAPTAEQWRELDEFDPETAALLRLSIRRRRG